MSLDKAREEYLEVHKITEGTPSLNRMIQRLTDVTDDAKENGIDFIRALHAAFGLAGESGEVLEVFKKELFGYKYAGKKSFTLEALEKELGDILWYFTLMTEATGISLEKLYKSNAEKLKERYAYKFKLDEEEIYPDLSIPTVKVSGVEMTQEELKQVFKDRQEVNPFGRLPAEDESVKEILRYNDEC